MNLLAEIREGFGISWAAIRANKMRSGLTTLGIIIGIVTVTLMGATITGLDRAFLKSISALGADVFYVQRFNWLTHTQEDWLKQQKRRPIRLVEAEALAAEAYASRWASNVSTLRQVDETERQTVLPSVVRPK